MKFNKHFIFNNIENMKKALTLIIFLVYSITGTTQTKYFNTFTLINNGVGNDVRDNIQLDDQENSLSLISETFTFKNAQKTGKKELYSDPSKGDMVATQYKTRFYEIVLIRYVNYPNERYLKIIDLVDYQNYLIHLHNK